MIAVIFEVDPTVEGKQEYLDISANLKERLQEIPGFISIEKFQSLINEHKVLSRSFLENEESIAQWRNLEEHRIAQRKRKSIFVYRL